MYKETLQAARWILAPLFRLLVDRMPRYRGMMCPVTSRHICVNIEDLRKTRLLPALGPEGTPAQDERQHGTFLLSVVFAQRGEND